MHCPPNSPRSTRPDASPMPLPPLVDEVKARAPRLRGRLVADARIAEATWFRVGGPAEALFSPADEEDLAYVLSALPREIPVTTIGLGSNVIVRDGGVAGLVIRLGGRAFGAVEIMDGSRIVAGAATPDQYVAKAAAAAGVDGLAFLRGVPGSIGGALVMNAGAHGGEIKDALIEAHGIDRTGAKRALFERRRWDFLIATAWRPTTSSSRARRFKAAPANRKRSRPRWSSSPRRAKPRSRSAKETGGSTFKNPPGMKAWELIDKAGCRGLSLGGAQVSTMHCNFLINTGSATAADLEALGEEVKRRVSRQAELRSNGRSSASACRLDPERPLGSSLPILEWVNAGLTPHARISISVSASGARIIASWPVASSE